MVPLPLFKLGALLLRHVSKYGANQIKNQAHEHPRFRAIAAKYGQTIHQLTMRMSVSAVRNGATQKKAKERADTPAVKTEEQTKKADEHAKEKDTKQEVPTSIWKRKFRPLPEAKAVDLFADVVGDAFILAIAGGLIIYEYVRSKQKPDLIAIRITELNGQLGEEKRRISELEELERQQQTRVAVLEEALEALRTPQVKKKPFLLQ